MGLIRPYGLLIALGVAAGWWVMSREEKRMGLPRDTGLDLVLYALPPALVCARAYYVLFAWDQFRHEPLRALYFWDGGLAIYGGVIGGALGVLLLSRKRAIPFRDFADLAAPALLLGQAIGRWGNFFNREAYGYPVTQPFWQFFPAAVWVEGTWHMATFFYESVWNLAGFAFLLSNRGRIRARGQGGQVFLWYLIWYGLGRLIIEGLRTDSLMWGAMRVSQVLSMVLCAVGILLCSRIRRVRLPAALALVGLAFGTAGLVTGHRAAAVLAPGALAVAAVLLYAQIRRQGQVPEPGSGGSPA